MMVSMTGLGLATAESGRFRGSVLIRSLNHRFLELAIKVPRALAPLEVEIRDLVQSRVRRGRVEVSVRGQFEDAPVTVNVSRPLARGVAEALRGVAAELGLKDDLGVSDLAQVPGLLEVAEESAAPAPEAHGDLMALVAKALDGLDEMRRAEGARLASVLAGHLAVIDRAVEHIARRAEESRAERREQLRLKAREISEELKLDEARLYQEIARLVDRSDVCEELERLRSHLAQAREALGGGVPCGKTLDFLSQEMAREANTIASKTADGRLGRELIDLKAEIERLREQVQNVE